MLHSITISKSDRAIELINNYEEQQQKKYYELFNCMNKSSTASLSSELHSLEHWIQTAKKK